MAGAMKRRTFGPTAQVTMSADATAATTAAGSAELSSAENRVTS